MERKPLNRRQQAKEATRALVLEKARAEFRDKGFAGATIRSIAKATKMSTGAVFANFTGKADLYHAVHGHLPLTPEQGRAFLEAALAGDAQAACQLAEAIMRDGARLRAERDQRQRRAPAEPPADEARAVRDEAA